MKFRLAAFAAIAVATLSGCQMTCSSLSHDPTCGSPILDPTCGSPDLYADTGCSSNFAPVVSSASASSSGIGCSSGGCGFNVSGGNAGGCHAGGCQTCGSGIGAGGCGGHGLSLGSIVTAPIAAAGVGLKPPILATNLAAAGIQHALQGTAHGQHLMQKTAQGCANGWCNRPMGPESGGQVQWPYYTVRGPRDFFLDNPPSIGP